MGFDLIVLRGEEEDLLDDWKKSEGEEDDEQSFKAISVLRFVCLAFFFLDIILNLIVLAFF